MGILDFILLVEFAVLAVAVVYATHMQFRYQIKGMDAWNKESKNYKRAWFITKLIMSIGASIAITMVIYESVHGPYEYSKPVVPIVD